MVEVPGGGSVATPDGFAASGPSRPDCSIRPTFCFPARSQDKHWRQCLVPRRRCASGSVMRKECKSLSCHGWPAQAARCGLGDGNALTSLHGIPGGQHLRGERVLDVTGC
jgi:hypothetical protein